MHIHEPATLATDYMLTVAAAIFAARLWRTNRMWALAFLFTAFGSFLGGTYHGFAPQLAPLASAALWKCTTIAIGLASFFLLAGSERRLSAFALVKFIVYASWMIAHDDFIWVIADYGVTLLLVGIVVRTKWVIASILVSVLGAIVQISGNNVVYHLIQLVALWLLYRGGKVMNRSTAPRTTQPT